MAVQSLYRRYRPRRFSEVKGQDHVVRALRNAVIHQREGQAYLFSGPRGTGKTTSARILAKVLNCENPADGEPCCACASCLAVEAGTSYDVHELDAASNNGVDAMRDLIEKASLGTPGRHKVYILDEVHMLSKAAEAALLKTLEEPPPHVVFVLATTDPQKVSATIRSRTQQLEFHLLPIDELDAHVRWVAADAGLEVSDDAIRAVLAQGGGSARDTLSALELVASSGVVRDELPLAEIVESLVERDPGRALAAVAHAAQQGRDARVLAESLLRYLRDGFLTQIAPELAQLPESVADEVGAQARRLGTASLVRAMEKLGETLIEMRHAPDQRVLLEVALVRLAHDASGSDTGALLARVEKLEQQLASGVPAAAAAPPARPAPVDPATGRVVVGGRARREAPARPAGDAPAPAPAAAGPPAEPPAASAAPPSQPAAPSSPAAPGATVARAVQAWTGELLPGLKPAIARAVYSSARMVGERDGAIVLSVPNEPTKARCEQHRAAVEALLAKFVGTAVPVVLLVDGGDHDEQPARPGDGGLAPVVPLPQRSAGAPPAARDVPADDDVDLDDLVDAPPEAVQSPLERLAQAFPGSELIEGGE